MNSGTIEKTLEGASIPCTVGVMAYNEGPNIGRLLECLKSQKQSGVNITEIIVIASGCTDSTEAVVRHCAASDLRIRLFLQTRREGKAAAINLFLAQARERLLVLCSADLILQQDTIEQLVRPFADPEIGLTTCRPVPVNDRDQFMGFAAHLLWNLHHQMNLCSFKGGEVIAFRKSFERIPYRTPTDEASIEPVIRGQGYKAHYVPDAVVFNKGPETVQDFIRQRRRIFAGHLAIRKAIGYSVSTMSNLRVCRLAIKHCDWSAREFVWTAGVAGLEGYCRFLGWRDFLSRTDHGTWDIASSTKQLSKLRGDSVRTATAGSNSDPGSR